MSCLFSFAQPPVAGETDKHSHLSGAGVTATTTLVSERAWLLSFAIWAQEWTEIPLSCHSAEYKLAVMFSNSSHHVKITEEKLSIENNMTTKWKM
jgi:hypothetical protein